MAKSLWTIPEKRKTSRHAAHDRRVRATGASATTTAASKSCAPILNRAAGSYPALAGAGRAAPRPPSPPRAHGPEVGHSVFVIPPEAFKARRPHIVILNDVAWSIIESPRGKHPICVLRANRLSASAPPRPPTASSPAARPMRAIRPRRVRGMELGDCLRIVDERRRSTTTNGTDYAAHRFRIARPNQSYLTTNKPTKTQRKAPR